MKNKLLYLLLIITLILSPLSISADGGAIRPWLDGDWTWTDENSQQAFINYEEGKEKLIIAVDLDEGNSDIAWIVPIPSQPDRVELDIASELPIFYGDDVMSKAKISFSENLKKSYCAGLLGQVWTFPFALVFVSLSGTGGRDGENTFSDNSLTVSSHIEKTGMVSEVITAKDSRSIYNYFSQKGFNIEKGSITELDSYIAKDYSFVVSWINSKSADNKGERGIFVSFPISKIYYPLILTSAYEEAKIPVTIRVVGHIEPELYPEIEPYTKVSYFTERTKGYGRSREARCVSDMNQIKSEMKRYKTENYSYPSSLEKLLKDKPNIKDLMEDINDNCKSYPSYISEHSDNYTMRLGLSSKVYEINSDLFADYLDRIDRKDLLSPELQKFYGTSNVWKGEAEYTKININAPAKLFKKDLWMEEGRPFKISLALWTINNPWVIALALYLLIVGIFSFIAGGITGLIRFRKFKRYALVGLGNLAGIFGLLFAFNYIKKKKYPEEIKYSKANFCFTFSIIFCLLLGMGSIIMTSLEIGWATTIAAVYIVITWGILLFIQFLLEKIGLINFLKTKGIAKIIIFILSIILPPIIVYSILLRIFSL